MQALQHWLASATGITPGHIEPASGDASFRRYFRVTSGDDTFIAMDAPPAQENCAPFIAVAGMLEAIGLNAPRVIAANEQDGFLLLTDLGTRQYLDELRADPGCAPALYADALDALDRLQDGGAQFQSQLPPYDTALLTRELSLFHDWLCERHLGLNFSDAEEAAWRDTCDLLIESALAQPRVFVHRDYHSRNLMVCDGQNPGILDFQDAMNGPLTYDLVSLLKDCYIRWPDADIARHALDFHARASERLPGGFGEEAFLRAFHLMGVQRHLKAAGIFARLNHRDGKPGYLPDVPRTLGYVVDVAARYPELAFLDRFLAERCLPALEVRA